MYRTDENGTIVATSNGKEIKFNCDPGTYNAGENKKKENSVQAIKSSKSTNSSNNTKINSSNNNTKSSSSNNTSKSVTNSALSQSNEQTIYVTNTEGKYHRGGCQYLRKSQIPMNESDAINQGYAPCNKCRP
ncbi:metallo beta-lactamase superfamily hydrolase [Clostridium tetani 12124569]|nr:metallo beta-lactamase superfamily hydrolase [Clostridium tetani 12124569]